jgi:hypothetical protein
MRMDKLIHKFQQALADRQSLAVGKDHQRPRWERENKVSLCFGQLFV